MAETTFTWAGVYTARKTVDPLVHVIKFGDGYEQRQGHGINRQPRSFSLKFPYPIAIANDIEEFLMARGALEAFNYTHPGQSPGVFVCRKWERENTTYGFDEITATFEEVYE